ncbi:MAG: hypothetical protein JNM17_18070 [Archangium sp.]|nr:hypothetical protein [Archangium sp.]
MSVLIPCANCAAELAPGAKQCVACGSPAIVLAGPEPKGGVCAVHPERLHNATCARCGSFACAVCLMRSREELVCLKCAPAPRPATIPLENRELGLTSRFVGTWWAFIVAPGENAERVGDGPLLGPLFFSWCCWLVPFESLMALMLVAAPNESVALFLVLGLALTSVAFVTWSLLMPLGEWVALRAAGVQAPLRTLIRVASCSSALWSVPVCGVFPLGLLALLFRLVAVRRGLELSWPEALVAVSATPIALACLVIMTRADLWLWL